jgi:hypothetical protein
VNERIVCAQLLFLITCKIELLGYVYLLGWLPFKFKLLIIRSNFFLFSFIDDGDEQQ